MSKRLDHSGLRLDRLNDPAFFGAPFVPIGYRHFEELRTKSTRALLHQPESHASPWLTTNALSDRLQDPEEYVHLAMWRNLKRHLYGTPAGDHHLFFTELAAHSDEYKKIFGPVSVAKRSAIQLGWCVQASGHIITHENAPRMDVPGNREHTTLQGVFRSCPHLAPAHC